MTRLSLNKNNFSIDTFPGYANLPELSYIDHINHRALQSELDAIESAMVYRVFERLENGRTLYISDNTPIVRFYCHDAFDENGYGGAEFSLKMEDGTTKIIRGPWSSNAATFNKYLTDVSKLIVEVSINGRNFHMRVCDLKPYLPDTIKLYSVISPPARPEDYVRFEVYPVYAPNGLNDALYKKVGYFGLEIGLAL